MKTTEELVSAVAASLREHALSGERYDALTEQTGDNLGSLRGAPTGWEFDVNGLMVTVTAQTKEIRETAQDAFADALRLRDVLITASEVETPRGELGVSSVHDGKHAVTGWLGQVYLIFPQN
jgi:ATP phosphoribosyltransferase regulatory subunit HisZ